VPKVESWKRKEAVSVQLSAQIKKPREKCNHEITPTPSSFVLSYPAKKTAGKLRVFVIRGYFTFFLFFF
jgi:hypothetical protein